MTILTVSAADVFKGGACTVELLAHTFTLLSKQVDLAEYEVHILLDNTASSNKNNTVFAFIGLLVLCKIVKYIRVMFLRVGHTHEDI